MKWLLQYSKESKDSDRINDKPNYPELLALGLMGEAGSMLAELKKERREEDSYPAYRHRLMEECGDFLWYLIRLIDELDSELIPQLKLPVRRRSPRNLEGRMKLYLEFGTAAGQVLEAVKQQKREPQRLRPVFTEAWRLIIEICQEKNVDIHAAARDNIAKARSRWPKKPVYLDFFDDHLAEEEQLPRNIEIEFREQPDKKSVVLRSRGLNFGDRLTDNIRDEDGYRYHDIFHFAYAVYLGWSPVTRKLLRLKRKSDPKADEAEDGARAGIIEEAVSAIAFSRAKKLKFFDGINKLDYDLLKMVSEFVEGYEVKKVPLWQWEVAILQGFHFFRKLRENSGGRITLDLRAREITFYPPKKFPGK